MTGLLTVEGETTAPPADWWFGTNRPAGVYYAGRVHVVHPHRPAVALCGLPIDDVWQVRPPEPEHLCPDCCVMAVELSYPPFLIVPPARLAEGERSSVDTAWSGPILPGASEMAERSTEETALLPMVRGDDDP